MGFYLDGYMHQYPFTNFHDMNDDWILGVIKNLIKDWQQVEKEFTDLQSAVDDLKEYVKTYFDNLDVQTEINNKLNDMYNNGTLTDLINTTFGNSKKLRGYENVLSVAIGDSYARGTSYSSESGGTIVTNMGWSYWLKTNFHYDMHLYASGGAGYITPGTSGDLKGKTFIELAQYAATELSDRLKNVEYVFLSGGINDSVTKWDELVLAVDNTISYLKQIFTSAKILIGSTVLNAKSMAATPGAVKKGLMIESICKKYGVGYITNSTNFFNGHMTDFNSGDDIHPNTRGYEYMANRMQAFIDGANMYDSFMDYIGNANGNMKLNSICNNVSVNPPRIICENGTFSFKGACLLNADMTSATRIITGLKVPPANYNSLYSGIALLYNPNDALYIGTTIYDFVDNPDNIHQDIRLQRMYNETDKLYNRTIPTGTRIYLLPQCVNITF